jgi:hypothetical protein
MVTARELSTAMGTTCCRMVFANEQHAADTHKTVMPRQICKGAYRTAQQSDNMF